MNQVAIFALACTNLDSDQIYVLFEEMLTDDVRELIFATYPCNKSTSEPVRAALYEIGVKYKIKSLIDY